MFVFKPNNHTSYYLFMVIGNLFSIDSIIAKTTAKDFFASLLDTYGSASPFITSQKCLSCSTRGSTSSGKLGNFLIGYCHPVDSVFSYSTIPF